MAAQGTLRRFSVDEYNKMGEVGIFSEDDRVELIRGEIVEMAPISVLHAWCVTNLTSVIFRLALDTVRLSVQNPIYLDQYSEALPDITLLRQRDYSRDTWHPGPDDVLLIVEVADTTVTWDRKVKVPLYAQTAIPEVWTVNLQQGSIEVHSRPEGGAYQTSRRLRRGQSLAVPGFAEARVKVDDVLG
ncbi:MAG: Uma2 family endonuclease [Chloroflexota bacterium]|nr:Uma2 family endonuclease [Chloroflexota bacterium]MDQ5864909.1 Uma2 family endonuclease [Chloroflexota bacterium]